MFFLDSKRALSSIIRNSFQFTVTAIFPSRRPKTWFWVKSLNNNDRDQVFWARETEHLTQTLVLTKEPLDANLVKVIVI